MDIYTQIKQMIVKELAIDEKEVISDAHLQDDLGADSLALLELSEVLSKQYKIKITGDDLMDMENVGALVKEIETRIACKEEETG
ncbi:MAG: acyl carrier protein [bacterium]